MPPSKFDTDNKNKTWVVANAEQQSLQRARKLGPSFSSKLRQSNIIESTIRQEIWKQILSQQQEPWQSLSSKQEVSSEEIPFKSKGRSITTTTATDSTRASDRPTTRPSMGLFGERVYEPATTTTKNSRNAVYLTPFFYSPGAVILPPTTNETTSSSSATRTATTSTRLRAAAAQDGCSDVGGSSSSKIACNDILVRRAVPLDDVSIASLRLSVFSDFTPEVQRQFFARSCQAIASRRARGAVCLVATCGYRSNSNPPNTGNPPENSSSNQPQAIRLSSTSSALSKQQQSSASRFHVPHRSSSSPSPVLSSRRKMILGSVECSFHEFFGTQLGTLRPFSSILYITEVAVSPWARRRGIATKLLHAVELLAQHRGTETLYLHVDVTNSAAILLYQKAGYRILPSHNPVYANFTTSLNLHPGATKGRCHYLMNKNLTIMQTWYPMETAFLHRRLRDLGQDNWLG